MLKNITIENYRVFDNFKVSSLANVNLIVGKNNSGKSSLLEAIHLLMSDDVRSSLLHLLNERGEYVSRTADLHFDRVVRGGYQISHIFHEHMRGIDQVIEISSGKKTSLKIALLSSQDSRIQQRLPLGNDDGAILDDMETRYLGFEHSKLDRQVTLPLDPDGLISTRRTKYSQSRSVCSKLVTTNYLGYDEIAILWDDIQLTPKEKTVVEALQILEPKIKRIAFASSKTSNSGILLQLDKQDEPVPLGSMGDGMRRILAVVASLANVDGGTLLVDEIDTGLHYAALKNMWKLIIEMAYKQGVQVFATTHSGDCVNAFKQVLEEAKKPDVGKLFRLEREGKQIRAVSYLSDELSIAIEQDIEVR